ncbi:MAG: efflux RND transporter periplasmic adaptor subunit [Firmicutes bacterium]|nr:efflux RND transporter periplasmic adaptor subunit [Bacillota bacterium]
MKKNIICMLLMAATVGAISGCGNDEKKDEQLTTVNAFTVGSRIYENSVSYTGYVSADELKRLSFELGGKIESISVEKGDRVQKGQVVALLDDEKLRTASDNAQENVKLANSSVSLANSNIELAKNKIETAQTAADEIEIGIEADKKTLEKIETGIEAEKLNLSKIKSNYESSLTKIQLNYDNIKKTYDDMQSLFDEGVVSRDDYDKAKLAFDTVEEELANTKKTRDTDIDMEEKKIESLEQDHSLQLSQIKDKENKLSQALQQKQAAEIALEQANTSLSQANTSLTQANIALEDSRNNLKKAQLISSIDGYVAQLPLKAGEVTGAGTPVVVIKGGDEVVYVSVPAEDYADFKVGMNALLVQNGVKFTGSVTSIDLYPDETTRTYNMEITPSEKTGFAMASLVDVYISFDSSEYVSVPISSIASIEGIDYVYMVVQNENGENILKSRQVSIVGEDGENVFVKGIENNAVIAADEVKRLYDNEKVQLAER